MAKRDKKRTLRVAQLMNMTFDFDEEAGVVLTGEQATELYDQGEIVLKDEPLTKWVIQIEA